MAQNRRNRTAFWVFLLLVALGTGWAANQEVPWPFSGWLTPAGDQGPQQEAEVVVQPIAEPQETPEPAPVAVTEPDGREPEAERVENAPPATQEPATQSAAPAVASSAPAGAVDVTSPLAGDQAETEQPAADLADATAAGDQTVAAEAAGAAAADQPTGAEALAAEGSSAQEAASPAEGLAAASPPVEGRGSGTESAATDDVPGTEATDGQPRGTEMAAMPAPADPDVSGDPAAGSIEHASPRVAALAGEPGAPPAGAQVEPAAAVEAVPAPGAGPEPAEVEDAAYPAANAPAQEVAALLSDAKDTAPSFDVVRVEPDGRAVIAGRAAPGAEVELRAGDEVIDRVRASRRGDWVAIPGKPLSPGDQQLTAVAALKGEPAVESQQMVVVAVPERALPVAGQANVAITQPMAMLLPRTGRGTGRILQAPGRLSAEGTLALMSVGYDQLGQMLLSGEAPPGVPVRVYVDNRPVALVVGDAKGTWSSGLNQALAPGTYTLRLDQLDAEGQTVARIETPITRVSEPPVEGELQVDYVVVQPGNSLWRIARRLSGKGVDYVYIYDRNQAQIRDPDLIYPGQVFQIPPEVDAAG